MITEIESFLKQREWAQINLTLQQFQLPTDVEHNWFNSTVSEYVIAMIGEAEDGRLLALHNFVSEETSEEVLTEGPWDKSSEHLQLFLIHLAAEKEFVGLIATTLGRFGIDAFVAHVSIEPAADWVNVIRTAMHTCHAAAAFLHPGFRDSVWTDQEVGFCLARRVPILPLVFDADPHGYLAGVQGVRVSSDADQASSAILDWLTTTPSTHTHMTAGLVSAMVNSGSWDTTRAVWRRLKVMQNLTPTQLESLDRALHDNINVGEANLDWEPAKKVLREFIASRT